MPTKKKSPAKKPAKKSSNIKAKLAKGAKEIQAARAAADKKKKPALVVLPPPEKIDLPESTRPIQDILDQYVEVVPGSIGLMIDDNIPIEESMRVLDYVTSMSDHVGFMIGDVLNFGNVKYGEKYQRALNQTGRAYSTLAGYAETAKRIPVSQRIASLSFSAHREIVRVGDPAKMTQLLKDVTGEVAKGKAPTTAELRDRVGKLKPAKKPKKTTKKKSADKPDYTPSASEQAQLDDWSGDVEDAREGIDDVKATLKKLGDADTQKFVKLLTPLANLCDELERSL